MQLNLKNNLITCAVLLLTCQFSWGQQNKFRYKADVAKISSDGVYKIRLQPKFTAKSGIFDLSDIRLIDEHGKFVAYSVIKDSLGGSPPVFIRFQEVAQTTADTTTEYIADAGTGEHISNLWLRLKNTEVSRLASLSGSDDLKLWFAIKEGIELQSEGVGNKLEYEQMISFPTSAYRYYRVQINNKNHDPVKIIQSGVYIAGENSAQVKFDSLPPARLTVKNGKQKTNYLVKLDDKYFVDGLKINITAPKYYERVAFVNDVAESKTDETYLGLLSSSDRNIINISAKTKEIAVAVENGDDVPLTIRDIIPIYTERSVVAYLEECHQYSLLVGDSTAKEVSYDLTFLHSKPMWQVPLIQHAAVYKNPAFRLVVVPHARNYTPLIWAAIVVVLIVLSLLTLRMVKEVNTKREN